MLWGEARSACPNIWRNMAIVFQVKKRNYCNRIFPFLLFNFWRNFAAGLPVKLQPGCVLPPIITSPSSHTKLQSFASHKQKKILDVKFSRYHCRHNASDLASIEKLAAELHVKSFFTFCQSPIVLLQLQHFHQVGVLRSFLKHRLCQLLIGYFSYP